MTGNGEHRLRQGMAQLLFQDAAMTAVFEHLRAVPKRMETLVIEFERKIEGNGGLRNIGEHAAIGFIRLRTVMPGSWRSSRCAVHARSAALSRG